MRPEFAIAVASYREARRNRITLLIGAFAASMILLTGIVLNLTIYTLDRVVTDFGLGVMSLMLVAAAIFLSSGQVAREIEQRTIFLVMSRALSRGQFIIGRYLGIYATLLGMLAVMAGLFALQVQYFEVPATAAMVAAVLGLACELALVTAIGLLFSASFGRGSAAIATTAIYFLGHFARDFWVYATLAPSAVIRGAARTAYVLLPNLDRLDYRNAAAHGLSVSWGELAASSAYGFAYTGAALALAVLVFSRRDFR
jgi:ABC-type transport system involved in multi-copper enzyme maturation permease subunit